MFFALYMDLYIWPIHVIMYSKKLEHFDEKVPIHDVRFKKASESAVCRLVRRACQDFAWGGGNAKSGCHDRFLVFIADHLHTNGRHSFPLTPYRGNRFNILFHNAGVVYWLHKEILSFVNADQTNL